MFLILLGFGNYIYAALKTILFRAFYVLYNRLKGSEILNLSNYSHRDPALLSERLNSSANMYYFFLHYELWLLMT